MNARDGFAMLGVASWQPKAFRANADEDIAPPPPTGATHLYRFSDKFGSKQKGCKPKVRKGAKRTR